MPETADKFAGSGYLFSLSAETPVKPKMFAKVTKSTLLAGSASSHPMMRDSENRQNVGWQQRKS